MSEFTEISGGHNGTIGIPETGDFDGDVGKTEIGYQSMGAS